MAQKKTEQLLKNALIHDGEMDYGLYEFELDDLLDEMTISQGEDDDDYIFSVTVNRGNVAMVLIDESGNKYVNEAGRDKLKEIWKTTYSTNLQKLIPIYAKELDEGQIPINGIKVLRTIGDD